MSNTCQNVRYIRELLSYALEAMAKFPHGYAPDASGFSELSPKDELTGLKEILGRTDAQRRINEIAASSPEELHSAFLHCGELLGRCLQPYGVLEPIGMIDAMNIVLRDPELMQLAGAMTDPIFLPSQHQSGQPRAFCLT